MPAHRRNDETLGEVDMVLMRLGGSFDRIMQRCAARLKLVPHETLRWLNSIDPMKPAGRPFTLKENEKSMYRYRQFMKRCLVYCSRAARLGRSKAQLQHQIQWTDEQWRLLEQINEELTRLGPVRGDLSAEECAEVEAELDQAVFQYCISMLRQQVAFKVFVNPLLHFAAVLGINDVTGGWAEPKHYTASLAGLVWCSRMLMLEDVFQDSPEDPNEVSVDMVEQFKAQQRQWLADGTHSPFSTMIRWMAYGKGFRTKEGGTAKVLWEENGQALRYLGQRIKVEDFVDAANAAVADAEAILDRLVFGEWKQVQSEGRSRSYRGQLDVWWPRLVICDRPAERMATAGIYFSGRTSSCFDVAARQQVEAKGGPVASSAAEVVQAAAHGAGARLGRPARPRTGDDEAQALRHTTGSRKRGRVRWSSYDRHGPRQESSNPWSRTKSGSIFAGAHRENGGGLHFMAHPV